ncbi:pentatricopeptide repeat (PPR) superfamily protein [Actinidia rufa]|uniref:Pentatricopeptide repeat (PPR) superfamily protein n=1 Tax=Actinidia rufa TaxID=165716 RepID=A0A7J0DAR6_9ERIC|nr:pentatricopeptide repeat (PPR) superfamily protein [Actinidia rufa]
MRANQLLHPKISETHFLWPLLSFPPREDNGFLLFPTNPIDSQTPDSKTFLQIEQRRCSHKPLMRREEVQRSNQSTFSANKSKVFDEMRERDLCSWNVMISGYAKVGQLDEARNMFDKMPERDNFSWTAMISGDKRICNAVSLRFLVLFAASAAVGSLHLGKEIYGHVMRTGLDSDAVVWSSLCDMYAKCGSIDEARHIFDKTLDRDVVSWTAMIHRYFEDGRREEGFALFSELLKSGIRPNEFTFAGVLHACADQTVEDLGKQVHGYMTRIGFDPFSFAASTLVHMYSKCGNIDNARKFFNGLPRPGFSFLDFPNQRVCSKWPTL